MNRGLARRAIFERTRDFRYFESRIASAVRRGELEVHAYSELTTHFHMLVRSPDGRLSEAMRRLQNEYVRYFNRANRRDGPLFRGRFRSRRVDSLVYRRMIVRYIDDNALEACLSHDAAAYPFGSARYHTSRKGRVWICRDWIEEECGGTGRAAYFRNFPTRLPPGFREWVERRSLRDPALFDELTPLMRMDPPAIRDWMERKARLADGTKPGLPIVPIPALEESLDRLRRDGVDPDDGNASCRPGPWPVLRAGLLRELCGLTFREIGVLVDRPKTTVQDHVARHHAATTGSPRYADTSALVARAALDHVLAS